MVSFCLDFRSAAFTTMTLSLPKTLIQCRT